MYLEVQLSEITKWIFTSYIYSSWICYRRVVSDITVFGGNKEFFVCLNTFFCNFLCLASTLVTLLKATYLDVVGLVEFVV